MVENYLMWLVFLFWLYEVVYTPSRLRDGALLQAKTEMFVGGRKCRLSGVGVLLKAKTRIQVKRRGRVNVFYSYYYDKPNNSNSWFSEIAT